MTLRTRKLVGTIGFVLWLIFYALVVMAIGGILIVGRGLMFELPFYAIAGFAWLPPAMWIIRWMSSVPIRPESR